MIARPQNDTANASRRAHFRKGQHYQLISFDLDRTLIFHAKGAKHDEVVAMLAGLGFPTTIAAYQSATHPRRQSRSWTLCGGAGCNWRRSAATCLPRSASSTVV